MGFRILPDDRGVVKEPRPTIDGPAPTSDIGADWDSPGTPPELLEALAESEAARMRGAMDFFWTSLAPFTFLVIFGTAMLVFVLTVYLLDAPLQQLLVLSGSVLAVGLVLLLPLEYHLVRSRVERPIVRLEHELLGKLPWRPEGDQLLGSLRRTVGEVRRALRLMEVDLKVERERGDDLGARLEERAAADVFADRVADVLRGAESVRQYAFEACTLVRGVWPAEDILLLSREETENELTILYWDHEEKQVDPHATDVEPPRYRKASLPVPVKEALRRGFYAESGLPFSQDPAFPRARSFVALALDHRGGPAGVLLAVSPRLDPPSAEPLRRAQPLFSIGFGRAMYVRELGEAEIRDTLTGAFTYDHFLSVVRHEVARGNRYSRPVSCLMVDIDGLRRINDTHGSAAGDRVIGEVSQLVSGAIRSSDSLARISGGRLALLLPETNADAASIVAERVRSRVEEYPFIVVRNRVARVTVSVGIGVHPPFGVTALALVDAAQRALHGAKEAGRNRVELEHQEAESDPPPVSEAGSPASEADLEPPAPDPA
ncbi:MAG: GGDEF domain-containing protein [Thermoleophilia bacterium]